MLICLRVLAVSRPIAGFDFRPAGRKLALDFELAGSEAIFLARFFHFSVLDTSHYS